MLATRASALAPARAARPSRAAARLQVAASANGAGLAEGARVKVVKPVMVFHAPKHADGLQLEGMTGVIKKDVTEYKGKTLSANLPFQVVFDVERDGKPAKLLCHLEAEEIAAV
ncbi:Ferredoxin-thioredoxin reductase [Scenedesmus sp. PABB004]|nr:Ferredoxin-thioredoxin reductase [Scenedesmus sp. PABB004]